MNQLSAKERDIIDKEFQRAKNLHVIKMQEEQRKKRDKEAEERKARKCAQREEA